MIQDDLELIEIGSTLILHQIEDYSDFVGCGGFANVYRVPGTEMVVKKLKDEFKGNDGIISRFKQEFYLINEKLLGIKGIIEAYEYNADEISYTMKFYSADLKKYIENAYLDEVKQIELILEILEIMRQVHERGVWHRDLSPKNIFIQDGHPIIADFGLGKAIDENGRTYVTIDTSCNGTLEYCDPRQFQGLKFADAQSDIYSLGRIINYIMTKDSDNFKHKLSLISTGTMAFRPFITRRSSRSRSRESEPASSAGTRRACTSCTRTGRRASRQTPTCEPVPTATATSGSI